MLQIFSFLLMFIGSLNWFFISAFQYDFVAGFFGTQSSLFSRFIYFLIGMAGFVMVFYLLKNKGSIKLFQKKQKQSPHIATPVKVVENQNLEDEIDNDEINEIDEKVFENQNSVFQSQPIPTQPINFTKEGFKDFDASKYDD